MRTRLLLAVGLAVATVIAVMAVVTVVVVVGGDDGPTAADREALAAALADDDALAAVDELAADSDRWERLVAGGGADVARLLDRAQPALGRGDDADAAAAAAAPVVEPLLARGSVDADVRAALARWTWPLLAVDDPEADVVARVLAVADAGDDELDAVVGGVVLARTHRVITSPGDGVDAIEAWRADLAAAAVADGEVSDERRAALVGGDGLELPASLGRGILASWGAADGASAPFRAAIAGHPADEPVAAGSVRTIAAYIAVIDDEGDAAAARAAAVLAAEARDLVELEDELFNAEDPALFAVGETATLLMSA